MSQRPQGVRIAIDWENMRRGVQLYHRNVRPAELCRAMQDVGCIFGEVTGGKAFGDWSLQPEDGREFAELVIVPYHAPRTSVGKNRYDTAILMEVYEWVRDRDDCSTVILGSGDSDYQALVDRARVHGRRILLCAFSQSVSRNMLATAPIFPLEAELGIRLAQHGDVNLDLSTIPEAHDEETDDILVRFVWEIHNLESRLSFVGYSMMRNQWMLEWGMGWNEHKWRRLIDEYQENGIVERHEVANRNNPDWPTSAIGLVRTNETVRQALGFSDGHLPCIGARMMFRGVTGASPERVGSGGQAGPSSRGKRYQQSSGATTHTPGGSNGDIRRVRHATAPPAGRKTTSTCDESHNRGPRNRGGENRNRVGAGDPRTNRFTYSLLCEPKEVSISVATAVNGTAIMRTMIELF